ncbi:hypothetical protein Cyrtocomes_00176 [Candidatus Cyrtobacter comes]|uniref:Uncharacterized protein n=1 Tax=Candidatus Cyrtobacter comes TaxID=675776 RepID=A0ABU5L6R7_9RICK|nr:hypothetical protein [Candidatus Cyrtobacter comes]
MGEASVYPRLYYDLSSGNSKLIKNERAQVARSPTRPNTHSHTQKRHSFPLVKRIMFEICLQYTKAAIDMQEVNMYISS